MSIFHYIPYDQGPTPTCTLLAITYAVREACMQNNVLLDFKELKDKLETSVMEADPDTSDSEFEEYENVPGIGIGYHPSQFNGLHIKRLENIDKKHEKCYLKVYVDEIGSVTNAQTNFSCNDEYVVVEFNEQVDHTMYVIWYIPEGAGYFLCRNSMELGVDRYREELNGVRYKKVHINQPQHIYYKVRVVVKKRLGSEDYQDAQNRARRSRN